MKNCCLLLFALTLSFVTFSQLPGWSYNQPLLVHENSGSVLYDYQLKVELNTAALIAGGQMQADGSDIRFSTSCTGGDLLNYWIESGINTALTTIWVKIDSLPASGYRTIYMHYGNASATAASAIAGTFNGPHSATDSLSYTNPGGVGNSQRGFRFSANEEVLVTAFGKFEPTGSTRYITLFDFSTQAILSQQQVGGPAAQYTYGNLPSPIWLIPGTDYLLEMYQGNSDGYYFGAGPQIGEHLTYHDMRYCNSCDQNTFPTNSLSGIQYGYPDLWYFTRTQVAQAPAYAWAGFAFTMNNSANLCTGNSMYLQAMTVGGEFPFTYSWTGPVDLPNNWMTQTAPTDTTVYTITATDACGTTVTDTITVNVVDLPTVSVTSSNDLICNGESAVLSADSPGNSLYWISNASSNTSIVVMPSVTTTYPVVATSSYGCTDTAYYTQQVNVPGTATQNISICVLDSYTINNHTYTQSGTYVDTIAGVTSCDSIVTTVLTIEPLPQATHTVTICFGASLTVGNHVYTAAGTYVDTLSGFQSCDSVITTVLTINADIDAQIQQAGTFLVADAGADSYQWYNCTTGQPLSGETGEVFAVTENGTYACILTVNGCDKQSNCLSVMDLGTAELSMGSSFTVFPVPASEKVTILSSADELVSIFDLTGKEIVQLTLVANEAQQLQLGHFQKGVYVIRHLSGSERLVIE